MKSGEVMEEALVSVILPTYNRAFYLPRAIESVLSQEYQNLELIIVDDGSDDNTREIVEQIKDKRIVFMRTPNNRGVSAARNAGIRRAKGKYIAFQDSDDQWLPGKLEKQVRILENSPEDVAMVYHIMSRTVENQKRYVPSEKVAQEDRKGNLFKRLLFGNFIGTPAICVRSSVLKEKEGVGLFDIRLPNLEDYELVLRIAKDYRIEYIDEVLIDTYALEDGTNLHLFDGVVSNCMLVERYEKEMKEMGIYESRIKVIRDFGKKWSLENEVEEIILKFCKGTNE